MYFYINEWQKIYTYQFILIFVIVSFILSCILLLLSFFIAKQNSYDEKISSYECGFVPFEDARNKFEIRFYIVAILFLIFDIEVIYLFPWAVSLNNFGLSIFWAMMFFLIILVLGFVYEICKSALDWQ